MEKTTRSLKNEYDSFELLTKRELSLNLKISKSFIDLLIANEGFPHYKIGKAIRFKMNEVAVFLERRKRP